MRILSHYFMTRYLGLYAMVLVVALLVLATVELVLNLDDIAAFSQSNSQSNSQPHSQSTAPGVPPVDSTDAIDLGSAGRSIDPVDPIAPLLATLRYLGLRLTAYYLPDVLPIASFVAVFLVFAISGRALERLAIEAGGIPPIRIVLPVLGCALILSLATALLHETVVLHADRIWSGEQQAQRDPIDFGTRAFWLRKGRTITNVARADPETRTLHEVEIFERDAEGHVIRVIRADRVRIAHDGRWHLAEASQWRFDPADPLARPRYERAATLDLDLEAVRGDQLLRADPELLALPDLANYLAGASGGQSVVPRPNSSLLRAQARFHERLSRPWLVLVFAWLALPYALRIDGRGRIAGAAIAAVATLALYFLVESAGTTLTREGLLPVGVAPWATMAVFCLATTLGLLRRAR